MKNTALKIVALTLGLSAFAAAHAQEGLYVGANISAAEYKEDGVPTFNPTVIGFKLGNQFNQNFAIEGRLGTSLSEDSQNVYGVPVSVEVNNFIGVYAKGILPLSNVASLYGLIGYTHGEVTASAFGYSASVSDSDVSYGIGAEFAVSRNVALNVEWAHLFQGTGYEVNAFSFGMDYKF